MYRDNTKSANKGSPNLLQTGIPNLESIAEKVTWDTSHVYSTLTHSTHPNTDNTAFHTALIEKESNNPLRHYYTTATNVATTTPKATTATTTTTTTTFATTVTTTAKIQR